jgi:hypothetical protein
MRTDTGIFLKPYSGQLKKEYKSASCSPTIIQRTPLLTNTNSMSDKAKTERERERKREREREYTSEKGRNFEIGRNKEVAARWMCGWVGESVFFP